MVVILGQMKAHVLSESITSSFRFSYTHP